MNPIQQALSLLKAGKLVAIPTETVYGLAANANNPEAIQAVFKAKGRPSTNPLIVHIHNVHQLNTWAQDIPNAAYRLAEKFWPGPLTLILKKAPHVSPLITANQETIAIRVPNHPLTQELLEAWQGGLVAPSANRYCSISPTTKKHVEIELGSNVDFILDGGPCPIGIESSILNLSQEPYTLLREGMITQADIEACLGQPIHKDQNAHHIKAPGQNKRHYAPKSQTRLVHFEALTETVDHLVSQGLKVIVLSPSLPTTTQSLTWIAMPTNPENYAQQFYAKLRLADQMQYDCIVLEQVPLTSAWAGILDRQTRASSA